MLTNSNCYLSLSLEEKRAKPPCSLAPRPKELLDLFIGKKHEMEDKLSEKKQEEIKLMNTTSSRRQRARRADDNEWIAILKGELNDRSSSLKELPKQVAKAPYKSPFAETDDSQTGVNDKGRAKFQFISRNDRDRESKMARPKEITDSASSSSKTKCSLCVRCKNQVALVDRILISGFLIHRSCLTCSKCGVTLRLSEVRSSNFVDDVDLTTFNYLCILCSKNKVNSRSNLATSASTSTVITGKPPLDCISVPDSNGKTKSRPRSPVSSLHERLEQEKNHQQSMASFAATDEYELRLKERMKWKERFLMNNNNDFDLGLLIQRQILKGKDSSEENKSDKEDKNLPSSNSTREASVDRTDSSSETTEVTSDTSRKNGDANREINERIGYENTSRTRELFDDDELTKLLNLESDQWESNEEEEEEASTSSSESDQRSEDSTEADFDSDEAFDASTASKLKSQGVQKEENQTLPEIVIESTDPVDEEVGTATGDEIDTTGILDIGSNSKGQTTTITNLSSDVVDDNNSSDSDTLAGEATDSNLVEDEERVKLLNSSATSPTSTPSSPTKSSSGRLNSSTDETESEIWSESHKSNKEKSKPKKLATLAEMESINGSLEALPLVDQENTEFLSPNRETFTTAATIGSPAITKSYTVSPSTFETKSSSNNTLNSPSLLRSISASPETSNTSNQSNVRSPFDSNSNITNLTDTSEKSETLLASPSINYTYTGLSNITTSQLTKMDDKEVKSVTPVTINNTVSTSGDTSKQVGSSLFLTSNLFSSRSNSYDAQNTTTATSFASISHFTNPNQSKTNTNTAPPEPRVKLFNSQFNCLDSVKSSSSSSPGFRVAQPKITVFNLDAYKLPSSVISGSNSGLNKSLDQPESTSPVCSFRSQQNQMEVSSVDYSTEGSSQVTTNNSSSTESYSRIPILSKRTLPAYRGSFTDKLLERCRSTPSLDAPDARKLSLASAPPEGNVNPPPENSVLAKWACSNLLQMSTHEVGGTPLLPFLKNEKANCDNNSNSSSDLHRNSLMSNSHTFGKSLLDRSNSTHSNMGHSLKYESSRSNALNQSNGQSSLNYENYKTNNCSINTEPISKNSQPFLATKQHFNSISGVYSSPSGSSYTSTSFNIKNNHPSPLANEMSITANASATNATNASSTINGYLSKNFSSN